MPGVYKRLRVLPERLFEAAARLEVDLLVNGEPLAHAREHLRTKLGRSGSSNSDSQYRCIAGLMRETFSQEMCLF